MKLCLWQGQATMDMDFVSMEDRAAASAVAALAAKRGREDDDPNTRNTKKLGRSDETTPEIITKPPPPPQAMLVLTTSVPGQQGNMELQPSYPFFYYEDFSTEKDPDPLMPLTPPGRVPNFPAKMHSILSRSDLADVIAWMPHGRSWRVLKPREFDRIIPTYFEHAKFSSFIRQANGWGFRRITQGRDRNSYYHPLFLRGLPHHCKKMKRPGVSQKQMADPDHEPDLYKISEIYPIPENSAGSDDSILLHCTLQGGPKARMPIYSGAISAASKSAIMSSLNPSSAAAATMGGGYMTVGGTMMDCQHQLTPVPRDQAAALSSFQNALLPTMPSLIMAPIMSAPQLPAAMTGLDNQKMNPLAIANQLAFANPSQMAAAFQASSAAVQFAAGFAAATALSHQQFQSMLGSLVQQQASDDGGGGVMPVVASAAAAPHHHQPMESAQPTTGYSELIC